MSERKPPNSRRNLDIAIQRKFGLGESFVRVRTAIANVVVAQMLHALTTPNTQRVHDLIDLQIIMSGSKLDLTSTRRICERLFSYRDMQPWPSEVKLGDGWDVSYAERAKGLDVLSTASEAVTWANSLIKKIAK